MTLKILNIKSQCTGCGACVSICPKNALNLSYNEEGFYYPHIDSDLCVYCKSCEHVCHVLNLNIPDEPSRSYTAYMCKAHDKDIVMSSSSGGVFSILAAKVLQKGGAVYGARYDFEKERLEHSSTDSCSLKELRKSNYIESFVGTSFKSVKEDLQNKRDVLFCGTPCQVAGLTTYLERSKVSTDKLTRIRFICHGVPSNQFFTEYKHFEERRYGAKMKLFDFRPKNNGWKSSDWLMEFENGKDNRGHFTQCYYYYYYYYFQHNYLLRESCYKCEHLKHEISDFTIADFWGIKFYKPENSEKEGLSLVLAHTQKAREQIETIKDDCEVFELPISATDYIYKDAITKETLLSGREQMMKKVIQTNYMNVAKKTLRNKIIKNKFHGILSLIKKKILK